MANENTTDAGEEPVTSAFCTDPAKGPAEDGTPTCGADTCEPVDATESAARAVLNDNEVVDLMRNGRSMANENTTGDADGDEPVQEVRAPFELNGWRFAWSDTGHSGRGWYGHIIDYPVKGTVCCPTRADAEAWCNRVPENASISRPTGVANARVVADFSDDEIMDAIARRFGEFGFDYEEDDDTFQCWPDLLAEDLGVATEDASHQGPIVDAANRLYYAGRLTCVGGGMWFAPSPAEWAKRLVGKSVEEIQTLLEGQRDAAPDTGRPPRKNDVDQLED